MQESMQIFPLIEVITPFYFPIGNSLFRILIEQIYARVHG